MGSPSSLKDLAAFLAEHKFCEMTDLFGTTEIVRFSRAADGGLWFDGEERQHYLPVRCGIGVADRSETGLDFDPAGFTLTKFGRSIRVRYLTTPDPGPSEN